ncbi:MAG: SRPBCC family protein [Pirellulaceae bacterium]
MPKYHIAKSIEIAAPPQRVFECVADYGTWTTWSPWLIAEPTAKVTVSKPSNAIPPTVRPSGTFKPEQIDCYRQFVTSGWLKTPTDKGKTFPPTGWFPFF